MINLSKFCAVDNPRMNEPFSKGAYSYATNGHIAIRVPRLPEIPEKKEAPDAERVFIEADKGEVHYEWVSVPEVVVETVQCEDCNGAGKREYSKEEIYPCAECDGEGRLQQIKAVPFRLGERVIGLSNIYIDLIRKELPNPQIGLTKRAVLDRVGSGCPVKIKFDGGEGLLMPCAVKIVWGERSIRGSQGTK